MADARNRPRAAAHEGGAQQQGRLEPSIVCMSQPYHYGTAAKWAAMQSRRQTCVEVACLHHVAGSRCNSDIHCAACPEHMELAREDTLMR